MKELISVLCVISMLIGLIWYNRGTKNKSSKPNLLAILAFLVFATLNALTYIFIVHDLYKASLLLTTIAANLWITIVMLRNKNYLLLKRDVYIIITGLIVVALMMYFIEAKNLHIIMQIAISIPFIPIIMGVLQKKGKEPFMPWMMMLIGTALNLAAVLVEYTDFWSLIHPVRSLFCMGILLISIKYVNRKKIKPRVSWAFFIIWIFPYYSYISSSNNCHSTNKKIKKK